MLAIGILFLILLCRCHGFPEQVPDVATVEEEPIDNKWATLLIRQEAKWASLLSEQEAKTASLLRQQEEKWANFLSDQETETASTMTELKNVKSVLRQQEENISNQEQKLSHQESLLSQQEQKLLDQEDLLLHQGQKLSRQEILLSQHDKKVLDQEDLLLQQRQKLSHQESLLSQQEKKLYDQEDLLLYQGKTLSRQESLLQEQGARLSYQEGLLQQQGTTIQQLRHRYSGPRSFLDETSRHSTNMSQPKILLTGTPSDSTPHDVMPRSDDTGPWEAVMSHISQQVTEMGADIQMLKNSNIQQDMAIQDAQSSTFVHWGSSTCSSLSHTVYSGVVGGSWWDHSGAATNYLCLTMSPVFSNHAVPTYLALLYGGEYETFDSHYNKDPVCSLCRSTLSTTVMIPGTNVCTPGWHLHYSGFLMAGEYRHQAGSEFICVDSKMENTVHGDANENGIQMHYTVTRCGSLPCSPYINNKVVTCAVCSK